MEQAEIPWLSPTHFGYFRDLEVVTNWSSGQLLYRRAESEDPWQESSLPLRRPHSFAVGKNGRLYVADTHNDRVVELTHPGGEALRELREIAGRPLRKPHDIAADPARGLLWVLDNRRLCQLRDFGVGETCLRLSDLGSGYARGISVVGSEVYLVASTLGQVVRIEDFERRRFETLQSPGKKAEQPAGSWETTGLVLNDVEFFDGFWYGSSFFHEDFAQGTDPHRFRLIRWRTWDDFEAGRWQDLSPLVPEGLVPYFFTATDRSLWVAAHSASLEHQGWVFRIADRK